MKRFLASATLLVALGFAVAPAVVLGACGDRPLCGDCESEETCEVQLLCNWNTDVCENSPVISIGESGITYLLGRVSGLFADTSLLLWVVIGVPLGFFIIYKVIGLVPKKTK